MLFFRGRAKYLHEHTSALPFLPTNHNRSLPAYQGLTPLSHHTRNKCTLIRSIPYHTMPILYPWKYSIRHKLLYCPVCIFSLFPWQPTLCSILPLFLYLGGGVLQEVDIISTVRPYSASVT